MVNLEIERLQNIETNFSDQQHRSSIKRQSSMHQQIEVFIIKNIKVLNFFFFLFRLIQIILLV